MTANVPAELLDAHLNYLDYLCLVEAADMKTVAPLLVEKFSLSAEAAASILEFWTATAPWTAK